MIITHPGSAHRDDFLSCCVLVAKFGGPIFRRNPIEAELADEKIFIVDVGGEYNPLFRNFDHHQFEKEHEPECAFSLVMKYLDLHYLCEDIFPWYNPTKILDSKGPNVFCKEKQIPLNTLYELSSPIEGQILHMFSDTYTLYDGPLVQVMSHLGRSILDYITSVEYRLKDFASRSTFYVLEGIPVLDAALWKEDPVLGLELYCQKLKYPPVVTITFDDRGDGFSLFRRLDDPRINFSRIEGHPDVVFAHKNGFVAKVKKESNLNDLIMRSMV